MENDNQKRLVDKWLDPTLKLYGSIEPNADLEDRLLRKLRAMPRQRAPWQFWSAWATVGALALAIAGVLVHYQHSDSPRLADDNASRRIAVSAQPIRPPIIASTNRSDTQIHGPSKKTARHDWPAQFPTPQPLSEQEKLLVRYVRERPTEARQVAEARAELHKQDLLAFDELNPIAENSRTSQP
jgi:hypothetical protein